MDVSYKFALEVEEFRYLNIMNIAALTVHRYLSEETAFMQQQLL